MITADCDLLWQKTSGSVSYVPAFTTNDLVWYRWRLEFLPQVLSQQLGALTKRINKAREKQGNGQVSEQALSDLLKRTDGKSALSSLGLLAADLQNTLAPLCGRVTKLTNVLEGIPADLDKLKSIFEDPNGDFTSAALTKKIESFLNKLPGDIFPLPHTEPYTDSSLYVMLRHVGEMPIDDLTARSDDVRFGSAKALRIGRVSPQIRYALTQQFARVFSDIGLPTEYEKRCKECASDFLSKELS